MRWEQRPEVEAAEESGTAAGPQYRADDIGLVAGSPDCNSGGWEIYIRGVGICRGHWRAKACLATSLSGAKITRS